jgi:chromosome segregation ATPase
MTLSQKDEKDAANEYFVNTEAGPRDWWNSLRRRAKVQPTQHDDYIAQLQEFRRQLDDMRQEYETTIKQLTTDNTAKDSEITKLREVCEQSIAKQQEWQRKNSDLLSKNNELLHEKKDLKAKMDKLVDTQESLYTTSKTLLHEKRLR